MRISRQLAALGVLALLLAGCGSPPKYSLEKTRGCLQEAGLRISGPKNDFVARSATAGTFRASFREADRNAVTISFGESEDDAKQTGQGYVRFHAENVGVFDILEVDRNAVLLWQRHANDTERAAITSCLK